MEASEALKPMLKSGPKPILKKLALSVLLLALTVGGAIYLFSRFTGGWGPFLALAATVSMAHWVLVVCTAAAFYLLDYVRLYCLLRVLGVRLRPLAGIRITCVSYLMADLTLTSELYLPVVIFLLALEGVPVTLALAAGLAKGVYMMLWLCALCSVALRLSPDVALPPMLQSNLTLYLSPLFIFFAGLALIVLFPGPAHALAVRGLARTSLPHWLHKIIEGIDRAAQALARVGRSRHPIHLVAHLASTLTVGAYVGVGLELCHALKFPVSFGRATAAFTTSLLVGYTSPVPGSIGIAETVTSYLLNPAVPDSAMAISILLRMTCWYFIWVPGAVFLALLLRKYGFKVFAKVPQVRDAAK